MRLACLGRGDSADGDDGGGMTSGGCRARAPILAPAPARPGQPHQDIIIESNELSISESDINNRVVMHPTGYSNHNLCRQIDDEDDTHLSDEAWGAQLLVADPSGGTVNEHLIEDERDLATAFVNFVRQPLIDDLENIEKDDDGELIDVSSFSTLPPLPLLKRTQNPIWYHPKTYKNGLPPVTHQECEVEVSYSPLIHNRHQQNKKSLPHKKRISRKLKKNGPHNSHIVQEHDETNDVPQAYEIIQENGSNEFHATDHNILSSADIVDGSVHVDRSLFICQLCGEYYGEDQLKFFYHLKQHYEPPHHNTSIILESMHHDGNSISMDKIEDTMGVGSEPLPDSLVDLSLEDAVSNNSLLYQSQDKMSDYDNEKSIFNSAIKSPNYTTDDKSILNSNKSIYFNGNTVDKLLFACTQCPKTFKRQKQFEAHAKDVHTSKVEEMSEFSEPEDLMEGIHVVVENENEEYLQEDLSSQHSNTLIIRTMENHEQYILPHLTIENGQVVQQPHLPTKEWFVKEENNDNVGINTKTIPIEENHSNDNIEEETKSESINSDELVVCPLCGSVFSCRKDYEDHTQQYHMDLKEEELERMMNIEVDVSDTEPGEIIPFDELDAEEDSEGVDELEVQEKVKKTSKDKKKRILKCMECGKHFKHKNSMIYHMLSHNGTRSFECDVCSKTFVTSGALKVHSRLHSGDRPYKCVECNRKFRQWGDLKYHFISIHSKLRQHQCEFCGKNFARKYSLIIHRRIHTGEKTYRCDFCDKTFRASSYLQSHRKIHTGEKPYPCGLCGKRFRMKGDMRRHLRIHDVKQLKDKETLTNKISNLKELSISSTKKAASEQNSSEVIQVSKEESQIDIDNDNSNSEAKEIVDDKEIINNRAIILSAQAEPVLQEPRRSQTFSLDSNTAMYVWPMYIA